VPKRKNNKEPKKKLKWKPIEITRVKLSPEQAVLACCDSVTKGKFQSFTDADGVPRTNQCTPETCPGSGPGQLSSST